MIRMEPGSNTPVSFFLPRFGFWIKCGVVICKLHGNRLSIKKKQIVNLLSHGFVCARKAVNGAGHEDIQMCID